MNLFEGEQERERMRFEILMHRFLERWAPADPRDRDEFDRELLYLVRTIYVDAQQPVLDRLTQIAMASPLPFSTVTK